MSWLTSDFASILVAGFVVGIVVGLTGMGGGALMTPALIFLGVGGASTVVTADLTAAAIYRSAGAATHARQGSPNMTLAKWLILGSVPVALVGPWLVHGVAGGDPADRRHLLLECIGFALLFAAATYALRIYLNLRRGVTGGGRADPDPHIRPLPTLGVGRDGRPAGRHHQRRVGLGDHDRPADALPGPVRRCGWSARTSCRPCLWCSPPRSRTSCSTVSTGTSWSRW